MTGRGFAFLSIPRSYYGALTAESLCADSGASPGLAGAVLAALQDCGLVGTSGVVDLDIAEDAMHALALPAEHARELEEKRAAVWAAVSRGRYRNMFLLLREQVSHPPPPPPPLRTNRTRRVLHHVLIGHAALTGQRGAVPANRKEPDPRRRAGAPLLKLSSSISNISSPIFFQPIFINFVGRGPAGR